MKPLMTALLVLFCTTMLCSCEEDKRHTAPDCCFSFISRQIPHNLVVAYFKTSGTCLTDGIINDWVQEYIRDLEANS
ncbi:C-C motif chemokine 3 isoform X2 [Heterocephalus glaber]|uniref:C-C motif chemokine 3 isoform X2 n=1 Tax=Heterocephalus glaber TaxID=10181 RepID=A0AAX6QC08_HETGA|nr:C-C motif chemokine 3 isoform X2 [Heterocephalus glaber]